MSSFFSIPFAGSAHAQDLSDMFSGRPNQVMHSTGLYTFVPPNGWDCRQLKDGSLECRAPGGGVMTITHTTINGQLDSELMALNSEKELKKLPHYQRTGGGRLLLGEMKASVRSFTFDYLGNTEYPVSVEELYLVSQTKAVRVHFECMRAAMPAYARDLKLVYDTLAIGEVDAMGAVVRPAELRGQKKPGDRKGKKGGAMELPSE